jgi:hypothetical protein
MSPQTIDTAMARRMVETSAIRGASIIAQPGGWSVWLKLGAQELPLGAQRGDKPRLWRSLDRCVDYLRRELHIVRFDLLDATDYSEESTGARTRRDAAERLRSAHEAAAHDRWFRAQVAQGLREADAPDAEWATNEEVERGWAEKRAELLKRAEGSKR